MTGLSSSVPPATLRSIRLDDPSSWQQPVFLTIDIDWADDSVLADTIDLVEGSGAAATWFVTHETSLLARLRENPAFELGIHPNFNHLLTGEPAAGNAHSAEEVLGRLRQLVPEAAGMRSHSLTQSSRLLDLAQQLGLAYDANMFVPAHAGIELRPWRHWNGMLRLPTLWADDVHVVEGRDVSMADLRQRPGLKILAFHPVHVLLNTDTEARYAAAKAAGRTAEAMAPHRNPGRGVRTLLMELLAEV